MADVESALTVLQRTGAHAVNCSANDASPVSIAPRHPMLFWVRETISTFGAIFYERFNDTTDASEDAV